MSGRDTRQTVFPILPAGLHRALEDAPVLLDGMEVVFDQRVALTPVALESRDEADGRTAR
jgi:hypothetical protein